MSRADEILVVAKVSDFIEAYDFEVYDILGVVALFEKYRLILYIIIGVYLFGIYFGQRWMKNRPAYNLSLALFFWNLGLAVFSIIATLRALPEVAYLLNQEDGLYLATCSRDVHNYATSFWGLMFLLSKVVELGDTAFIVLRKQKLIVLHWFHHVVTLGSCWIGFEAYEAISRFLVVNTFVHSFMYSYYALKALKVKIPKKVSQALTTLQISQMLFLLVIGINYMRIVASGKHCPVRPDLIPLAFGVLSIFTILFVNFFVRTYWLRPARKPKST